MLGVLQENLITILSFHDEEAKIIRGVIPPEMFGGPYRVVAARIYDFLDKYKKCPKDHLADILDDKLNSKKNNEAELFIDLVSSIKEASLSLNVPYVMTQLGTFTRRQALRTVAIDLTKALQRDTEASLAEADALIRQAQTGALTLFDPGTRLSNKAKALDFFDIHQASFPTGVPELDRRGFGPTRKELWLLAADTKGGKTWALIHLAKMSLVHHLKVLHITLEMSEARASQRYFQALFSISKHKEKFRTTKFEKDDLGRISGFGEAELRPAFAFEEANARTKLERRIDKWGARLLDNIIIKQFPTGKLTVNQLVAYMDNLEQTERFIPDLLIVDYPDLMKQDKNNIRLSVDETYKDIRGIAVERNIAVAIVSQSHRAASGAKVVKRHNVAEAYSKVAHADIFITLSQTKAEKELQLARLFVDAGRNDADGFTLVISQNYGTGNFIVDSVLMRGNYFGLLPKEEGETDED